MSDGETVTGPGPIDDQSRTADGLNLSDIVFYGMIFFLTAMRHRDGPTCSAPTRSRQPSNPRLSAGEEEPPFGIAARIGL